MPWLSEFPCTYRPWKTQKENEERKQDESEINHSLLTFDNPDNEVFLTSNNFQTKTVNMGLIDNGCPSPVVGNQWLELYKHSRGVTKLKYERCNKKFKFGPSKIYHAEEQVNIPIQLGNYKTSIDVPVVKCDVPLLVSTQNLKLWGAVQDYEKGTLYIKKTGDTVQLKELQSGHYGIRLGPDREDVKCLENCFYTVNDEIKKSHHYSQIKKVHRYLWSPWGKQTYLALQKSGKLFSSSR